jgi:hypothetical protein
VELSQVEEKNRKSLLSAWGEVFLRFLSGEVFRHQMYLDKPRMPLISAYLSEIYGQKKPKVYRLDFKTRDSERLEHSSFNKQVGAKETLGNEG